jgi:hypothetical protein
MIKKTLLLSLLCIVFFIFVNSMPGNKSVLEPSQEKHEQASKNYNKEGTKVTDIAHKKPKVETIVKDTSVKEFNHEDHDHNSHNHNHGETKTTDPLQEKAKTVAQKASAYIEQTGGSNKQDYKISSITLKKGI